MQDHAQRIEEHAEVIGSDGVRVGTVDRVEGDRIKLTRDASGEHGFIPLSAVHHVAPALVRLSMPASEARPRRDAPGQPAQARREEAGQGVIIAGPAAEAASQPGGPPKGNDAAR